MCVRSHAQIGLRNPGFNIACAFLSWHSMKLPHFLLRRLLAVGLACWRLKLLSIDWFLMSLFGDVGQCVRLDSIFIVNLNLAAALIYYMSLKTGFYVVEMFTTSSEILSSSGMNVHVFLIFKASLLLCFFNCTCCDLAPLKSLLFTTPIACAFGLSRQEELLHACCEGSYSAWVREWAGIA